MPINPNEKHSEEYLEARLAETSLASPFLTQTFIPYFLTHDDTSLIQSVIPGLFRNSGFSWIPAGVHPVLDTGRE
jgi:hypothetical protein